MAMIDDIQCVHDVLVAVATGTRYGDDKEMIASFQRSRTALLQISSIQKLLPSFVTRYRDLASFWGFIKNKAGSYAERRQYLAEEFSQLFAFAECSDHTAIDNIVSDAATMSSDYVRELWSKAIERRETDPEGAITAARTLLEATCKYILGSKNTAYDEGAELSQLYKLAAKQMQLAPSQHTEQQFKQILGGAESVVNGLGSLRNKISDAHAIDSVRARPSTRHATLCVNMAGTMAEFLISTYEYSQTITIH
jgi:hypothetical protein